MRIKLNPIKTIFMWMVLILSFTFLSCTNHKSKYTDEKISTSTFSIDYPQLLADTTNKLYYYNFYSPKITSNVLSNGSVLVYLYDSRVNEWTILPITGFGENWKIYIQESNVKLEYTFNFSGSPIPGAYPGLSKFRVIIIPPLWLKSNINTSNYQEVKVTYNVPD